MKSDTSAWLFFADENLTAATILLERHLYNPCLQNIQQSIEKALKAVLFEILQQQRKTHSITELVTILGRNNISIALSEEDCDLLDSIYLPSKYPLGSVLPAFEPDEALCEQCISLAKTVVSQVQDLLHS